MKVIFLDIDGVITTDRTQYKSADPECMARLNNLVEVTGAKVVLTSTRRFDKGIRELLRSWGAHFEIWSITPSNDKIVNGIGIPGDRLDEIYEWFTYFAKEAVTHFVIIDDAPLNFLHRKDTLYVQTTTFYGFQDHDYYKALEALR